MYTGKNIDMHIHTCYSDGTSSPEEIIDWARRKGLNEIAITDHDNINGVKEAIRAGDKQGIKVHTGIEFSTQYKGGISLHILGYDFDMTDIKLGDMCERIRELREKRNLQMLNLLKKEYGLSLDEVAKGGRGGFIGKPMMARALMRKNHVGNVQEAFEKIFTKGEFGRIKKEKVNFKDAIDVINGAKGITVLAHPGLIEGIGERGSQKFFDTFEEILEDLCKCGLDGLECIYGKHSVEEEEKFIAIAKRKNLIVTRGSDYHGEIEK